MKASFKAVMISYLIFLTCIMLLIEQVSQTIMLSAVLWNSMLHRFLSFAGSSVTTSCSASNVMLWLA
jgi:branched-subunit amino acid transport protein